MKCTEVSKLLPALMAGELAAAKAGELRLHLAGCPECSALRDGFEADRALLHELPAVEPGPGLVTRVMAEVRAGGRGRARFGPWGLRTGLAAAALALLVAGGVWAGANVGRELARQYAGPGDDPLTVNGTPSLTEYVDATAGNGR